MRSKYELLVYWLMDFSIMILTVISMVNANSPVASLILLVMWLCWNFYSNKEFNRLRDHLQKNPPSAGNDENKK